MTDDVQLVTAAGFVADGDRPRPNPLKLRELNRIGRAVLAIQVMCLN